MAQSVFTTRMDENLRKEWDLVCKELGITISAVINILARKMVREQRIPFEVSINNPNNLSQEQQRQQLSEKQRIAREQFFAKYNYSPVIELSEEQEQQRLEAIRIIDEIRKRAEENGLSAMTLDDINAEIAAARKERKARIEREKQEKGAVKAK